MARDGEHGFLVRLALEEGESTDQTPVEGGRGDVLAPGSVDSVKARRQLVMSSNLCERRMPWQWLSTTGTSLRSTASTLDLCLREASVGHGRRCRNLLGREVLRHLCLGAGHGEVGAHERLAEGPDEDQRVEGLVEEAGRG